MNPKTFLWCQGLRQGQAMRFLSLGGSMLPSIRRGDTVTIVPLQRCQVGDIILYERFNGLFLHRVVAKYSGRIFTKGDAVPRLDPPIRQQEILGRAVSCERHGKVRSLNSLVSQLLGLAFSLTVPWVPGLLPLLAAVQRRLKERRGRPLPLENWQDQGLGAGDGQIPRQK